MMLETMEDSDSQEHYTAQNSISFPFHFISKSMEDKRIKIKKKSKNEIR